MIAQELYPDTEFYQRKHREVEPDAKIEVLIDECISPKLSGYFNSDMTTAFHVAHYQKRGAKDGQLLPLAGNGILLTEDSDFFDIIEVVYIDRVNDQIKTNVNMDDLPFIVQIEGKDNSVTKYHKPYLDSSMTKAEIREAQRQKARARQGFNQQKLDITQYQRFQKNLKEIVRLATDEDRLCLGIIIRRDGKIEKVSRNTLIDKNVRFALENETNVLFIDKKPKVIRRNITRVAEILAKAGITVAERQRLISANNNDRENRVRSFGEDKPYAKRHGASPRFRKS